MNPAFPEGWTWMALFKMPYRGNPLTILALPKDHVLYTTAKVESSWKQIPVSKSLQGKYRLVVGHSGLLASGAGDRRQ